MTYIFSAVGRYRSRLTPGLLSPQEIAMQQIMTHLDSIRKDMVILEKSEFSNLRSENTVPPEPQ